MSLCTTLFKSLFLLAALVLLAELASHHHVAYHSQETSYEPVSVSKEALQGALDKVVELEWQKLGMFDWLSKHGLTYVLYAVGLGVLGVMYYRHRLVDAEKRQGGGFSSGSKYGGSTTVQMNRLYNDPQFREWRGKKMTMREEEEEGDDEFAQEWRRKEDEIYNQ